MVKSKTLIEKQSQRKYDPELFETILAAKKQSSWVEVASILSGPSRKRPKINVGQINAKSEKGKTVIVPGKILSEGEIKGKTKIAALKFSSKAKKKLSESGCEIKSILEEIKSNPEGKGIKIIK